MTELQGWILIAIGATLAYPFVVEPFVWSIGHRLAARRVRKQQCPECFPDARGELCGNHQDIRVVWPEQKELGK
jgi:hypothetical protein